MKQKRKGHLPFWARPLVWGKGKLGRILWLNLLAGMLMAAIPIFLLSPSNFQLLEQLELRCFILPLLFLMLSGFYFAIASAFLIFWGYAEDEEL